MISGLTVASTRMMRDISRLRMSPKNRAFGMRGNTLGEGIRRGPLLAPNGIELSRLASPRILSSANPDTGLARSAPASC
jgi:hypothetical protein